MSSTEVAFRDAIIDLHSARFERLDSATMRERKADLDSACRAYVDELAGEEEAVEEAIANAPADIGSLLAAVDAVLEKHKPFEWSFGFGPVKSCKECARLGADETEASYPCPTVAAVTEALGADR